jgi:hypothetical protein
MRAARRAKIHLLPLRGRLKPEEPEDPIAEAVEEEFSKSGGRYGTRRIKRALAKRRILASSR